MLVKNILIGEDIRREEGNKLSLMGIFSSSINIEVQPDVPKETPVGVSLAFLICIENSDTSNNLKNYEIRTSMFLADKKFISLNAKIESTENDRLYLLPISKVEVPIFEATQLLVHVQIFKKEILVSEDKAVLVINMNRT